MKQVELNVSGMSCTGCEKRIETTLSRLEGVVRNKADHQAGVVTVVLNPAQATEDAVRAAITQAGFEVS